MHIKLLEIKLGHLGFSILDTRMKVYRRSEGRAEFLARPLVQDGAGYFLLGLVQSGTDREDVRWVSVKEEHLKQRLEDYSDLFEVRSLRKFQGQMLNSSLYKLLTKNKRVVVRVLKAGGRLYFREVKMRGEYIRADDKEYQCFVNAIVAGSYTMLDKDWERIKFLTKFL